MSQIKTYQTVSASSVDEFDAAINRRIALGWQPFGAPYAINGELCQAMVQLEEVEENDLPEISRERFAHLSNRIPRLDAQEITIKRR